MARAALTRRVREDVERRPQNRRSDRRKIQPLAGCGFAVEKGFLEAPAARDAAVVKIPVLVVEGEIAVEPHRAEIREVLDLIGRIEAHGDRRKREDKHERSATPSVRRCRARLSAESAFEAFWRYVCNAIGPGANYNMRLRPISDATACGSPSSATSSGPPSADCAPTQDGSRNTLSIDNTTCWCSPPRVRLTARLVNRSHRICSCEDSRSRFGSHPPYYFMPALLKMAASSEFRSVDVVHSVGYYFFGTVFAHALAKAHGVPHISTPVYTLNPSNWQRRSFDQRHGPAPRPQCRSRHSPVRARAPADARRRVRREVEHNRSFRRGFGVFRPGL